MTFRDFWYIVAQSDQLKAHQVLSRQVLDEWLVVFRDRTGKAAVLQDRCIHRNSRLSSGRLIKGELQCPYHGWQYDGAGQVTAVPAEGPGFCPRATHRTAAYLTCEQDGYVYVCLSGKPAIAPFDIPYIQTAGWQRVQLINRFHNSVTNCAENFIDIPHTATVHPGIFRTAQQQPLTMTVTRRKGTVTATYGQESTNLGWFSRFLNPARQEITHIDRFCLPNVTSVEYTMGEQRRCFITSQSIPETDDTTLVYTDVTYHYGAWTQLARPLVRWTAQRIIDQDLVILQQQQASIRRYGERFTHTPADTIHVFVESIRRAIAQHQDPCLLPEKSVNVTFWV